jgi:hypothetical protein
MLSPLRDGHYALFGAQIRREHPEVAGISGDGVRGLTPRRRRMNKR